MSETPHTPHGDGQAMTEPENLKVGWIVWTGVASLALFAVSILLTWHLYKFDEAGNQPEGPPALVTPEMGQSEVGIVNQKLFSLEHGAPEMRTAQQKQLNSYGWVNREAGTVHIPIEKAMDALVQESAP